MPYPQGELSMDCKPQYSYSMLLKSFADQTDQNQNQTYKLEEFISRLEEERIKIDAFKRELPLCMQLLTNAMDASKQQLDVFRSNQGTSRPILEEFIPIKHSNFQLESSEKVSNVSDKANWMTSAQLWSQGKENEGTKAQSTKETEISFSVSSKLALDNYKHRNGGAFLPFSKSRQGIRGLPELALGSSEKEIEEKRGVELPETRLLSCSNKRERENSSKGGNCGVVVNQEGKGAEVVSDAQTTATTTTTSCQNHRKTRRCWSPDLHRRFVNALQMLGGSQVATPKQIRELMKVDGLTNDEVKSHLQKYRLHNRRPSHSLQQGAPAPQLVVLGGIWVPPEYATAAAPGGASAIYGQHAPPPHYYAATTAPQEYCTTAPLQSPLPPLPLHHNNLYMYKTTQEVQGLPESEVSGGGDRLESIEDGKSESSSWKQGESGENEGERKGLVALREKGEESTGSEITLKF